MTAIFVELPPFQRLRQEYLDDAAYRELRGALAQYPLAGDLIEGTGGLRKLRRLNPSRKSGPGSGLRVIYYGWSGSELFWLFTVYDKDEAGEFTRQQREILRGRLASETDARRKGET